MNNMCMNVDMQIHTNNDISISNDINITLNMIIAKYIQLWLIKVLKYL